MAHFFALKYYQVGERFKRRAELVSIFDQIKEASNICIFTPATPREMEKASLFLSHLNELFPHAGGLIIMPTPLAEDISAFANFEIVRPDSQRHSYWGMPDKRLIARLKDEQFDLVLDLSIEFCFSNTSLVWHCNTPLRISFSHPKREKLYNFVIRLREKATESDAYKTLETYLAIKH